MLFRLNGPEYEALLWATLDPERWRHHKDGALIDPNQWWTANEGEKVRG